ncbi:MAG: peptidoglycan editing factor PgeF [Elainella sp. Prado103]|jgi:hypothetical protein|nr:peptidoglycan editing factor PgeF [Elainella sp. Prado103]
MQTPFTQPSDWHWQTWQGLPYLTCSLLNDWSHGFFTQQFAPRPPEALIEILHPAATVYRVKQVHGDQVLNADSLPPVRSTDRDNDEVPLAEADGLFTSRENQSVWACTADCTPLLIGDLATGRVAAIHAGWRGTAAQIVPKTIAQMQSQGSQLPDLRVVMGPAITGEVYQVSTTVAAQVGQTILPEQPDPTQPVEAVVATLRQLPDSPVLDDPQPGRARLDVRKVNALQLRQLGIEPDQIAIAPYCTYQNPDRFFSYRRESQKKVQWSGIVSWG